MAWWEEKILSLPIEDIHANPSSEDATQQSMQQALDDIKSSEHWSLAFGARQGHDKGVIKAVSRLIDEGVRRWRWDTDWESIVTMFPTATPSTFWIMTYSENSQEEKLYSRLAHCAKFFHPYVWTPTTRQRIARGLLKMVALNMAQEGAQEMSENLAAYAGYASHAGRIDG